MSTPKLAAVTAALTFTLAGVLSGCNENQADNGKEAPVASDSPSCEDVWKAGSSLPEEYNGCHNERERLIAAVKESCDDGTQLTTYNEQFWAFVGQEVHDTGSEGGIDSDPEYAAAQDSCQGG